MTTTTATTSTAQEEGLDYILRPLLDSNHYLFPRTIMTRRLNGQIEVPDKVTALREFELSNWLDCRINAYPSTTITNGKWINLFAIAPSIVFIDLDLQHFKNQEALDKALKRTLKLIQKTISSEVEVRPTVLWTGNGYHIYVPINGLVLENESVFAEFITDDLSLTTKFMRFAEQYFTGNKQDPNHKPSVNNCLLRIPGTYNSKNGQQIMIVQEWNGYRVPIQYMLREFRRYLIQEQIDNYHHYNNNSHISITKYNPTMNHENKTDSFSQWVNQNQIYWIEKLLLIPISNDRKYCIWRILAPYLVNVKKLGDDKAYGIIISWLEECSKLERLTFYYKPRVRDDIRRARRVGYYPISLSNLQKEKSDLHRIIQEVKCNE
jgi:Primase X